MTVQDILPVIVPGILIQVMVQAYYLKHCWDNKLLTMRQKTVYLILIALFNLPGAAIYLFTTLPKDPLQTPATDSKRRKYDAVSSADNEGSPDESIDSNPDKLVNLKHHMMEDQVSQGIFVLLVIAYEIFSLRSMIDNLSESASAILGVVLGLGFAIFIADGLIPWKKPGLLSLLLPCAQVLLIGLLGWLDRGSVITFTVLALAAGLVNRHPLRRAWRLAGVAGLLFLAGRTGQLISRYGSLNSEEIISTLYVQAVLFAMVVATFYSLKKQLQTNRRLADALTAMRRQALRLEEMSAAAERSRIIGEIHDTVGHTLTTAVVALEAGEKLIDADRFAALAKFRLGADQVRRGLSDLRNSIRTIQSGVQLPFDTALQQLLDTIRQKTDLTIQAIVTVESDLLPIQQNLLLRAIQELVTNSLKHGKSSEVDILIQEYQGNIRLTLTDNGTGCPEIQYGFGLGSLAERVDGLGGVMQAESQPGEGFTVTVAIPAGHATDDRPNSHGEDTHV